MNQRRILSVCALLAVGCPVLAQYQAVILHPARYQASVAHGVFGGAQVGVATNIGVTSDAVIWHGSPGGYTDLTPIGWIGSARAIFGNEQVGGGADMTGAGYTHALIWHGSAESQVDLHPGGQFQVSYALATDGIQQGGYAIVGTAGENHPALWHGTADSFVDLLPPGFAFGSISAVLGDLQGGGGGGLTTGNRGHALIWHGSPDDFEDMHPVGYSSSGINSMAAGQQVGTGDPTGSPFHHALLWRGTAASIVDLHPLSGYTRSWGFGTNGEVQVGQARVAATASDHAVAWRGTANTFLDLHQYLPQGYLVSSAYGIDELGNIVGYAQGPDGYDQGVVWQPVPEPAPWLTLISSVFCLARRTLRRARRNP